MSETKSNPLIRFDNTMTQNLMLGTSKKVIITSPATYNTKQVISIQCDVESTYSATYSAVAISSGSTALPGEVRAQNSVRGGPFDEVVLTTGTLILLLAE